MFGIDISGYQPNNVISLANAKGEVKFAIMKATQGTNYVSANCDAQYQDAKQNGILRGVYHFLEAADGRAQAEFFAKNAQGYIHDAIICVDFESYVVNGKSFTPSNQQLTDFCSRIRELTGVNAVIYTGQSLGNSRGIPALAKSLNCGYWVANYGANNPVGTKEMPQLDGSIIRQYSSRGGIGNYGADLDKNWTILTPELWAKFANPGGGLTNVTIAVPATPSPQPIPTPAPAPAAKVYGTKHINNDVVIGRIANFMFANFPKYTNKAALGNWFGPHLTAAIKQFQRNTKLEADGNVGPITMAKLKEYGFRG